MVIGDVPGAALAATLSCTLTSFLFAGMFLSIAVTFAGRPVAVSAISAVKPAARVAVTVTWAGLPGVAFASSNLNVSANGALSVTARPKRVNIGRGGTGRFASAALTNARTLANSTISW